MYNKGYKMKLSYLLVCLSVGTALIGSGVSTAAFAQNNYVGAPKAAAGNQFETVITKIDAQGYVYDSKGVCIARIDHNGNVIDGNNRIIAKIYSNGYVYNGKNDNFGRVDKHGNIYTPYSVCIGKVDKTGIVYNSNNVKVGEVAKDYKTAALLLLLENNALFTQY
ncbi:hypothetical protein CIN_19210 [Commensalibacter intestini A911]|uniref:WG repeat-containing protein n=2 Tax=Commensalibacter intestini TaxID=479936 RepID=G6F2S5_9PROT|nr:hypothetical protein CIN_19210 [Commensalibacter intestini A911]